MRFMLLLKSNAETEAGALPDEQLLAEMGKYNEAMVDAGVMLAGEGLHPSAKGARVTLSGPTGGEWQLRPEGWRCVSAHVSRS